MAVIRQEPGEVSEDAPAEGVRCRTCGRVNTSRAKFCNFCGTGLDDCPSAPLAPPVVDEDLQEELLHLLDDSSVENGDAPKQAKILVKIIGAKGLKPADISLRGATSDPFVVGQLAGRPETKFQTRFVSKNLNPEWNEEFEVPAIGGLQDLEFSVMDYDKTSAADLLGKIVLKRGAFQRPGGFHGELQLEETGYGYKSMLEVRVHVLWFTPPPPVSREGSRLKVTMIKAVGLRAADWALGGGRSDPFCTCEIEGVPELKVETKHINKTLEPVWNEEHLIPIYERGQSVTFKVFDYDKGSSADLLGAVYLPMYEFDREGGFEGDLRLMDCGDAAESMLTVRVEVLPPLLPDAAPVSEEGSRLKIKIISAKGLRAADWSLRGKGTSDPYCICELKGKPELQVTTKHISKTLEPVWDEEHELPSYERGDILQFTVYDYDRGSAADLLGRASLRCRDFDREGGFEGELVLLESGSGPGAALKVRVEVLPPLMPDAPPVSEPGSRLKVTMKSAKGLRAADWSLRGRGSSDPFCVFEIDGKPDMTAKTKHISKTLEPAWNETHELPVYERGDSLVFRVFDYDRGSAADLLGRVSLAARDFDREGGFEGELRLLEAGKGSQATLSVRVEVLPPLLPPAPPVSEPGCVLKVQVISAKGLRAADWNGKSDPFCVCELTGKPDTKFQTKTISKTLAPVWNEEKEIDDYELGDCLEFRVYDYDLGSANDLLGRALLPCNAFDREGGFVGELPLLGGGDSTAKLKVGVVVVPSPYPEAEPISEPGSILKLTIVGARGLRAADFSLIGASKSDPFCVAQVKGKPDSKVKTKHIPKTLDPVWNEIHELHDYDRGNCLEFSVWDFDLASAPDLLGKVTLVPRAFDKEGGFDGQLKLRSCGDKEAFLNVRIEVVSGLLLPPAPPVSVPRSRVRVQVVRAANLRAADIGLMGGASDPYCVVKFKGKDDETFETPHVKKTTNPVWNAAYDFNEYERGDALEFTILDHDLVGSDDLLGRALIAAGDFDREGGFEGELKLRNCGKGRRATISVKVEILPPLRPEAPPISVPGCILQVNIVSGKGLRAADWSIRGNAKSDPYCTCTIQGKPSTQVSTRHINRTLSPVWDEEHDIEGYERGDALEFQVFDHDMVSAADLLGRVILKGSEFDREDGFDGELRLLDCGKGTTATLTVRVRMILPSLPAPPVSVPGSRLRITVVRANSLRAADFGVRGASSDPFCRLEIKDKPGTKRETRWLTRTLDPVWNEEFEVEEYEQGDCLEFAVFDYDRGSQADFLGRLSLPAKEFDREGGFADTLKLKECGLGQPATLTLRVQVLPPLRLGGAVSEPGCSVKVLVRRAEGLSACAGAPDPFVECWLRSNKAASWFRTRVLEQTTTPVWEEMHRISDFNAGDRLEFAIMDQYVDDADLLGKCSLESMDFDTPSGFDGAMPMVETRSAGGTLSVKVEVCPPERLPLFITVVKLTSGIAGLGAKGLCCAAFPEGRQMGQVRTTMVSGEAELAWNEEVQLPCYVEGDALVLELRDDDGEVCASGMVPYSSIRRPLGFSGDVPVVMDKQRRAGSLAVRVLTREQRDHRQEAEEEQRRLREERRLQEERRRLEAEQRERERLQAEAEERAKREAAKRAAEAAARRAEELASEVVVAVLLWPSAQVLVQVTTTAGSTVLDFAKRAGRIAKLPLCPKMRLDGRLLGDAELLLDAGVCEIGARLSAEVSPAVLTCSVDGLAKVWNATFGSCELTLEGHSGPINAAYATPDLKWIATASADCTAKIWVVDAVMGMVALAWTLDGHDEAVTYASISSDTNMAVTTCADGTVKVWRMKDGACVRTLEAHADAALCASFTPDCKRITTTGQDGVTKTFGIESGRCEGTEMDRKPIQPTHFTSDGQLFLKVVQLQVEVRSMAAGTCLQVLRGHDEALLWVSFIPLRSPQVSPAAALGPLSSSGPHFKTALNAGAQLVLSGSPSARSSSAPVKRERERR